MNTVIKMWVIMGAMDLFITAYAYFALVGTWFVYFSIVPTIMLLGIAIPIQRTINQIDRQFNKQNGICYNCNLKIVDKDTATLEDETGKVYCKACHLMLYGHLYENREGVWYRKDSKQQKNGDVK